ncbi:hypothetical protein CFP65_1759 [Kitasatospora sp. MMS16-BH015]|uniref:hypothetical protein n=1 Tax=Kitasatospora sp. MMS16-BH015 TaxID=2018025 RepID=UPI000CA34DD3|nr:hypothetical protein [Kitasatospora sp. MMS16-BH015]AUG76636.1 hypothetical protein CFP65_1759 [Kitasatospora sp. MMS16-BH015]
MIRLRTAAVALALAGSTILPATSPAQAASRAEVQVNAFFSQYRDAVLGQNPNQDPLEVREEFMTPELNTRLDRWAEARDADPVFRAQNVPVGWSVAYGGSGAGHTTVILTEDWSGGGHTDVWYQVRLDNLRIDGLEDPPQSTP